MVIRKQFDFLLEICNNYLEEDGEEEEEEEEEEDTGMRRSRQKTSD